MFSFSDVLTWVYQEWIFFVFLAKSNKNFDMRYVTQLKNRIMYILVSWTVQNQRQERAALLSYVIFPYIVIVEFEGWEGRGELINRLTQSKLTLVNEQMWIIYVKNTCLHKLIWKLC